MRRSIGAGSEFDHPIDPPRGDRAFMYDIGVGLGKFPLSGELAQGDEERRSWNVGCSRLIQSFLERCVFVEYDEKLADPKSVEPKEVPPVLFASVSRVSIVNVIAISTRLLLVEPTDQRLWFGAIYVWLRSVHLSD